MDAPASEAQAKHHLNTEIHKGTSQTEQALQIPYLNIERLEIVKTLGIPAYAKVVLKSPPESLGDDGLVFSPTFVPDRKVQKRFGYRSSDFVELGNNLLANHTG